MTRNPARGAPHGVRAKAVTSQTTGTTPTASVAAPVDASASRRAAERPRADCTADSAGGLTFDVRTTAVPPGGTAPAGTPGRAALLLRLREGKGPGASAELPLSPAADGGLRVVLPGTVRLREGRWDAWLALADEEPRRLLPGLLDLRSLVERVPATGLAPLCVRIPYATKYGNLTVRSWLRPAHAECGPLHVADGVLLLRATLHGARLTDSARLEAHRRGGTEAPVRVPVHPAEERHTGREPTPGFTARLPLGALPPGDGVWDLWLRPSVDDGGDEGGDGAPVRLARILDDVADKRHIFSYPPQRVPDPGGSVRSVRPFYTLANGLSLRASCAEVTPNGTTGGTEPRG